MAKYKPSRPLGVDRNKHIQEIQYHWRRVTSLRLGWSIEQADQARMLITQAAAEHNLHLVYKESNTRMWFAWCSPWGDNILIIYDAKNHLPLSVYTEDLRGEEWAKARSYFESRSGHDSLACN
jgi:hypothetical protein